MRRLADEYVDTLPTERTPGRPIDTIRGIWRNVVFPEMSERSFARFWMVHEMARYVGAGDPKDRTLADWIERACNARGKLNVTRLQRIARAATIRVALDRAGLDPEHHLRGRDELTEDETAIIVVLAFPDSR